MALRCRCQPKMNLDAVNEFVILGVTRDGRMFRPTDWAERLAGVMSQFRPGGPRHGGHLGYSPWCIPSLRGEVRCVVIHRDLRDHDVLAWDFVVGFARDNNLQVEQGRSERRD
jgi:Protein of unknown function (DUF3579)